MDAIISSKLLAFADKYVQDDLSERCMSILKYTINPDNVYKILDFARQEDISHLRDWCVNFLKDKINPNNISGLVEYLNKQNNPEYAQENRALRDEALNVLTNNFIEISKNQKISESFYEDFLIKNVTFDTTVTLVNFISGHNYKKVIKYGLFTKIEMTDEEEVIEEEKEKLKPQTMNLRCALYDFAWTNLKTLTENKIVKQLPNAFLVDLLRNMKDGQDRHRKNMHAEQQTSQ